MIKQLAILGVIVVSGLTLVACDDQRVVADPLEQIALELNPEELVIAEDPSQLSLNLNQRGQPPQQPPPQLTPPPTPPPQPTSMPTKTLLDFNPVEYDRATLVTNRGEIVIELFRDRAPLTTANFLDLANSNFYNGIVFHRVEPGFVVQVGDPLTKEPGTQNRWGSGNPGYTIADEFHPELRHDKKGIVSMANAGPDSGGSQFFITLAETSFLDDKHAVFGEVIEGMEVVEQIQVGDQIQAVTLFTVDGDNDRNQDTNNQDDSDQ